MDYSELLTTVQNWADRADSAVVNECANFIAFATDSFNHGMPERMIAPLRVREMTTTGNVTPVDGVAALPADFLEMKAVTSLNSIRRPLSMVSAGYTDARYADRAGGLPNSFSVTGNSLSTYPVSSTELEIIYFQKIPYLSVEDPTNWLIEKIPALYLHAALYQLAMFIRNDGLLQRSAAMVASMIDGLNTTDILALYARSSVKMSMVTP